ncbi:MAG: hypothetical protein LPK14_09115 [Hymenobacteraceae bacterium]|nr:hypothetical protein [Hymenobacteraceae bacterium]
MKSAIPALLALLPSTGIHTSDVREDISTGPNPFLKIVGAVDERNRRKNQGH